MAGWDARFLSGLLLEGCKLRQTGDFTTGRILGPLIRFMIPVFLAMFLLTR